MRFYKPPAANQTKPGGAKRKEPPLELCLCHDEYNHCIANADGHIPEIAPDGDLSTFNPVTAESATSTTTTTTTAAPETVEALGFEV